MPFSRFFPWLTTRQCARRSLVLAAMLVAVLAPWGTAGAVETLRILTWPGYADRDLVRVFEHRHRVRVEVSLVSTDDALWARLNANGGGDFDVFAANTAELTRYIDAGISVPLDLARIPNTRRQLPRFRDLAAIPGITRGSRVYAIPYTYSEMGLIYDRRQIKTPPDSLAALWDPRYRGRVLAYDGSTHNFTLAALRLGLPSPFRLGEADWRRTLETLIDLRRNVLTFYSLPEESVRLFLDNRAALLFANYGSQQVRLLRQAGADIGYALPREGALAWLDCWSVTRGARNKALAQAWIDYTLERPVSTALRVRQGLANTIEASPASDPASKIVWLEPVEDAQRRAALWQRIRSGDQPGQFAAPRQP